MKRIIRALYANPGADLSAFSDEHVLSALNYFSSRLEEELAKVYRWLATCTVAVEAGRWGGSRRRARRLKLLTLINVCRTRLGVDAIVMTNEDGEPCTRWADVNLYYGYGAGWSYSNDTGVSRDHTFVIGTLDSHGIHAATIAAKILEEVSGSNE